MKIKSFYSTDPQYPDLACHSLNIVTITANVLLGWENNIMF